MNKPWKYNNTFIKYNLYNDKLTESVDKFIINNEFLQSNEKEEILTLLKQHRTLPKNIKIDWQHDVPNWDYNDFKKNLIEPLIQHTETKQLKKTGNLIEGKDYIILYEKGDFVAYQPLNHKASCIIANNWGLDTWVDPSEFGWGNANLQTNEDGKVHGTNWCISTFSDDGAFEYTKTEK